MCFYRAMHRSLQIPEILSEILASISPESQKDRASQAAMARTCKLFYEPAMNALWFKINSITPLLKCLPQYTWDEQGPNVLVCLVAISEYIFIH